MVRAVGNVLECILRCFLSVWGLPKDPRKLAKFKSPSVIQALNFKDALSDYHWEILMWTRWGQQRAN